MGGGSLRATLAQPVPGRARAGRLRRELRAVLALHAAERPGLSALGAGLGALTVLMGMGLLGLSGWFIAATALAGLQVATALSFDVFMPGAAIRILAIGRTASRYGERLLTHDAALGVSAALRERLFVAWARPQAARRLLARPARLLYRLTGDIDALESLYLRVAVPAAGTVAAALLAGVVMAWVDMLFALALFALLLAGGWGIAVATGWRARRGSMQRGLALERLRAATVDLQAGQAELLMAGHLRSQCERVAQADQRLAQAEWQLHRMEAGAGLAYGVLSAVVLVAVLLAAGWLVDANRIGAPGAALLVLLALGATEPFAALRRGAIELGRSLLAVRRIAPQLQAGDALSEEGADPAPRDPRAVSIHGLSLAHAGSPLAALVDIDLNIGAGERVALVGRSGAGKSSLLGAIAGELAPSAGHVQAWPASWMTQRTDLFQDSLRDNLRLAAPGADDARLWCALEAAGLARDVQDMPLGLDTRLGEGGLGLSGGQSRRLALARLLLRDSPLWLLDEPTEAMDTRAAQDVLRRLRDLSHGRSLVIATHLRREAALADRLLVVRDGRLEEQAVRGTPAYESVLASLRGD